MMPHNSKSVERGTNLPMEQLTLQTPHVPNIQHEWAQLPAVAALDRGFRQACETGLRAAVVRLELYLEDERTVRVLLEHVVEQVMDAYMGFEEIVQRVYPQAVGGRQVDSEVIVMDVREVREFLEEVCQG